MNNFKKVFLILTTIFVFYTPFIFASDYNIKEYNIEANVTLDGDLEITEYLKYYFSESMNGLYRDILYKYTFDNQKKDMSPTSSRYQANGVDNVKVYTSDTSFNNMTEATLQDESVLSNGMNNMFSETTSIANGYRKIIKVYSPVSGGHYKYVKYEYRIRDAAVNYLDKAEIFWNFVGSDWQCDIDKLNISVTLPNKTDIKGFGHTYAKLKNLEVKENKVFMEVENISSKTAVDMRIVFPNINMENVYKKVNLNYDFELLNVIEKNESKKIDDYHLSNKIWFVYIVSYIITLIIFIFKSHSHSNKNLKKYKDVEHYINLPDKYTLGIYNSIKNKYSGYETPNLLIATILDLYNRKYIKIEYVKIAKKFKDKYEYYLSVENPERLNELTEYEKELVNYLFNKKLSDTIINDEFVGNRFELNERFKELGNKFILTNGYRRKCLDRTTKQKKELYNKPPKKLWTKLTVVILLLLTVAFINIFFISPNVDKTEILIIVLFVNIFATVILSLIISTNATSLKEVYDDEYNRLLGLEKYLKEYSLIKDRYPIEIELWGGYLVYASLFGIANKVAKEFKEQLLNKGYSEDYIFTTYPMIHMGMHSSSIVQSASVASASGGSSSSGGYSGGGGGGGRRRWWRRSFLK